MRNTLDNLYIDRKKGFAEAVVALMGHLVGAAVIFVTFFALAWIVGGMLHWMHSIQPFPEDIYRFITKIEVWLIYLDAAVCGVVLLGGAIRFLADTVGAMK